MGRFIQIIIRYSDIYGDKIPLLELINKLKKFNRDQLLSTLSRIEMLISREPTSKETENFLRISFLNNETQARISEFERQNQLSFVFHREQILALMNLVLIHCSKNQGKQLNNVREPEFSNCFLIINDHLTLKIMDNQSVFNSLPIDEQEKIKSSYIIRNMFLNQLERATYAIARYYELFVEIPPKLNKKLRPSQFIDLSKLFNDIANLDYQTYLSILFGLYAYWITLPQETIAKYPEYFSPQKFFRNTKLNHIYLDAALKEISLNINTIAKDVKGKEGKSLPYEYNYVTLRKKPMAYFPKSGYFCLSLQFLLEKLSDGIYWTILNKLDNDKGSQFQSFLGYVFEEYVVKIFNRMVGNRYERIPYEGKQREANDGVINYGDALVFTEVKSGRLRLETTSTGDIDLFLEDMQKKLVLRAAKQLDENITRYKKGNFQIEGVATKYLRFYPVVITLQNIPLDKDKLIFEIIEKEINTQGWLTKDNIAPLQIISAEELEMIEPLTKRYSFLDILKIKEQDEYKGMSFKNFIYSYFTEMKIPDNEYLSKKFKKLENQFIKELFGKEKIE